MDPVVIGGARAWILPESASPLSGMYWNSWNLLLRINHKARSSEMDIFSDVHVCISLVILQTIYHSETSVYLNFHKYYFQFYYLQQTIRVSGISFRPP